MLKNILKSVSYNFTTLPSNPNVRLKIFPKSNSYSIADYGSYQTRSKSTIQLLLESLKNISLQSLKETTFDIWTDDFPPKYFNASHINMSYCNSSSTCPFQLIPDFIFWNWPEARIDNYEELIKEMLSRSQLNYKYNKLFWIGNPEVHEARQKLLSLRNDNEMYSFNSVKWIKDSIETSGKSCINTVGKYVSLPDHCDYKYLLDVEGRGYSGRLKVLLFSNRILFIQERQWNEYYWSELKPFVHYIPVKNNLSDLSSQLDWAEANPEKCRQIALNALQYAQENLTRKNAIEYLRKKIVSFASK